jgi:hypothetical protein
MDDVSMESKVRSLSWLKNTTDTVLLNMQENLCI